MSERQADTSPATTPSASPTDPEPKRSRNPWKWVSGVLVLLAVALLVWAFAATSDRDTTQDELTSTQQQLDTTNQELDQAKQDLEQQQQTSEASADEDDRGGGAVVAAGGLAAAKSVYDDLTVQLGATEQDLAATEQDLEDANATAKQAEQDAAAAEKKAAEAGNETDKAKAEADKAKADAKVAESRSAIVADCAKAYFEVFGALFEGDDLEAQASTARKQLESITDECQAALGSS